MSWTRLIKFLDDQGRLCYGEPQINSSEDLAGLLNEGKLVAQELTGDDIFTASWTGNLLSVKKILGPLSPEDVPVIRCVGLNYGEHSRMQNLFACMISSGKAGLYSSILTEGIKVKETGRKLPPYPSIFIKPSQTIAGWDEDVPIPKIAQKDQLDYEGELAILIGKQGKDIPIQKALDYVAGYTVANDVSARTWQRDPQFAGSVPQWCFSKGFDSWAPLGPMIVSPKVLGAADNVELETKVNGEIRQKANTNDLVFGVCDIVAFVSQGTTLEKGSVILTGTPGGVALGMKRPKWLSDGDIVEVSVAGIGKISNKMVFL